MDDRLYENTKAGDPAMPRNQAEPASSDVALGAPGGEGEFAEYPRRLHNGTEESK